MNSRPIVSLIRQAIPRCPSLFTKQSSFVHRFSSAASSSSTPSPSPSEPVASEPQQNQEQSQQQQQQQQEQQQSQSYQEQKQQSSGEEGGADKPLLRQGPLSWKSMLLQAALLGSVGGGLLYYYQQMKEEKQQKATSVQTYGKPALGGPWALTDHTGTLRTHKDYEGRWQLIYFGFTMCPDICPSELDKLTRVVNQIDKIEGPIIQPLFITIDPKRDTVPQVAKYIKEFHPRLVGFTGTYDEIEKVTRAFRVYWNKPNPEEEDYLVDHSIIMYLMDPEGQFVDFFGKNFTSDEVAIRIHSYMRDYKKKHGHL